MPKATTQASDPEPVPIPSQSEPVVAPAAVSSESNVPVNNDASNGPTMLTPAQPVPPVSSDDDGGWRVEGGGWLPTIKSQEVARRFLSHGGTSNAFQALATSEDQVIGVVQNVKGGEEMVVSPYLS